MRLAASDHPGPINIGNPREVTILQLAELIKELVGADVPITFVDRPEDDPNVRRPDIALAQEVLGWEPRIGLEEGLRMTIAWFAARAAPVTV